jgi:hypothetical protein
MMNVDMYTRSPLIHTIISPFCEDESILAGIFLNTDMSYRKQCLYCYNIYNVYLTMFSVAQFVYFWWDWMVFELKRMSMKAALA